MQVELAAPADVSDITIDRGAAKAYSEPCDEHAAGDVALAEEMSDGSATAL
jgi:hypothetical protein